MKIRTDFVTNSSSSSFVVEISIKSTNGEEFITKVNSEDVTVDFECSAEDVLKCDSIASLAKLLNKKIQFHEDYGYKFYKDNLSDFFKEMSEKFTDFDEIDTITFRGTWFASGEAASCFAYNLDSFAEELPELAAKVCELEGDEKEKAKDELQKYLSNYSGVIYGGWDDRFPSAFVEYCDGTIVWTKIADSIEEFAQLVVSQNLPDYDYSVETNTINMKSKNVTRTAEYILGGLGWDKEKQQKEDDKSYESWLRWCSGNSNGSN